MSSIGNIIQQHRDEIMNRWLREARAAASARGLSAVAMGNLMPSYLAALAHAFEPGHATDNDRQRKQVQAHLSTRLRQGFDLAEIISEFVLLERCIAAMWSSLPTEQQPIAEDIVRLHAQFQTAITDVTDTFFRHMLEDEQSEKRYLRLLQGIASDALHADSAPLRERLNELLEIVVEAMGAQCAAFLAYDTSLSKLVMVASRGTPEFEAYARSVDPMSFAAEVAEHDEPTASYDATSARLDVPASLQRSGIRALLGVRLPPRHELFGVMYIGIGEAREFTPREIGRLASLGERLAVHFENARLFSALQQKIDSLDVEKALREKFVATLAHDLRGPLSASRLAADLLIANPALLDERRDLAIRIVRGIDRVDRMIHDLLDANRIRAGERLPLRLDTCDVVVLAQVVAEEARSMHGDRFVVDTTEHAIRGIWSEAELHRALWNLVTNAVKYGAPVEPIVIAVRQRDQRVQISVHNAGIPIPAAEQTHIFDAYARARSANAGERAGWGLGLTLVRGVAEAHGGSVSVISNREAGTTFTIELPLDARADVANGDERAGATVH